MNKDVIKRRVKNQRLLFDHMGIVLSIMTTQTALTIPYRGKRQLKNVQRFLSLIFPSYARGQKCNKRVTYRNMLLFPPPPARHAASRTPLLFYTRHNYVGFPGVKNKKRIYFTLNYSSQNVIKRLFMSSARHNFFFYNPLPSRTCFSASSSYSHQVM